MKDTIGGTKQLSFRLPKSLVDRVDRCVRECESSGLDLTRADVVRLLLNYALTNTGGKLDQLIESPKGVRKRGG
jgi:Arc/MetJ-type ribon-helix-helix transcriptional regulator